MTIVEVTDNAARKVCSLLALEQDPGLKLRAYVTGGGCQGLQYGFALESCAEPDDASVYISLPRSSTPFLLNFFAALRGANGLRGSYVTGFSVLIDPISLTYLQGAHIDYVIDAQGERFVVRNPNAKTTCGCARSFVPSD